MGLCAASSRRLFIFDLDGTLIDSKADIAKAVNLSLQRLNLPSIPVAKILQFVGDGVQRLIQRSLREATATEPQDAQISEAVHLFREEYEKHLLDTTRLYPGVSTVLDGLTWAALAVVSNKPERYSRQILSELGIINRFRIVLGGDSTPKPKPDSAPLVAAMSHCDAQPSETVMIGDSPTDILAGKAAGVFTCGVTGGFRSRQELENAGCDLLLSGIANLLDHFSPPGSGVRRRTQHY